MKSFTFGCEMDFSTKGTGDQIRLLIVFCLYKGHYYFLNFIYYKTVFPALRVQLLPHYHDRPCEICGNLEKVPFGW